MAKIIMRSSKLIVTFWGTRGSIPTPGRGTLRYGGNTACVEVRQGKHLLILDAGTGIRSLGLDHQIRRGSKVPVLISHTHMDHIVGLPFFAPALDRKTQLRIFGPPGLRQSLRRLFPFPKLPARKSVREIGQGSFSLPPFRIESRWTNHPGEALAYRIQTGSRTIVYLSDHEPTGLFRHGRKSPSDHSLVRWMEDADLLIMDGQYFAKEYPKRLGWGHSPLPYTVRLALRARVKHLAIFHHDPAHSDQRLRAKEREARKILSHSGHWMTCSVAREGQKVFLSP